jgi:hypothetical protein
MTVLTEGEQSDGMGAHTTGRDLRVHRPMLAARASG